MRLALFLEPSSLPLSRSLAKASAVQGTWGVDGPWLQPQSFSRHLSQGRTHTCNLNDAWRAQGGVNLNCPWILPPEACPALPASPPVPESRELGLNAGRTLREHPAPSPVAAMLKHGGTPARGDHEPAAAAAPLGCAHSQPQSFWRSLLVW